MKLMKPLGLVENRGAGVGRMVTELIGNGQPAPTFREVEGSSVEVPLGWSPTQPNLAALDHRARDALAAKPLQYLHVSLWDFYKKARRDGNDEYRMKLIHQRINGRLPFIGVGKLYIVDDIA